MIRDVIEGMEWTAAVQATENRGSAQQPSENYAKMKKRTLISWLSAWFGAGQCSNELGGPFQSSVKGYAV